MWFATVPGTKGFWTMCVGGISAIALQSSASWTERVRYGLPTAPRDWVTSMIRMSRTNVRQVITPLAHYEVACGVAQ